MKAFILGAALLLSGICAAQKVNLTVHVSGFKSEDGVVKVGLYNSGDTFLKTTVKSLHAEIKNHEASVTFEDIQAGTYAVSVYHDENNNGKLDTNAIGIPSEDYASSNNAKGFMGPPKYDDAKFTVKSNSKIQIKLNN